MAAAENCLTIRDEKRLHVIGQAQGDDYVIYHGDCIRALDGIVENQLHFAIFSPPFSQLYSYTDALEDMSNVRTDAEFIEGMEFLTSELFRLLMPGRLVAFHCMQIPAMKERDGYIGLKDFRGDLIRLFQRHGFIYHSEVLIRKDPLIEATRTKAIGLMHKQLVKDSSISRNGGPDYLVVMRKPGENPEPITHLPSGFDRWIGHPDNAPKAIKNADPSRNKYSHEVWQRYADSVWLDIDPSDTLQRDSARDDDDSRHICLARGSLVLTRDGYIPIETVRAGDQVVTHEGRWRNVVIARCNGTKPVIHTAAHGVPHLITTPDHKLWCRRGSGFKAKAEAMSTDPEWIEAQSTLGSYLNLKLPPVEGNDLTNEEWWIVGRWLGGGHVGMHREGHGHPPYILSCSHKESGELIQLLGRNAGSVAVLTATQIALRELRPEVVSVLSRCGRGAFGKRLPAEAICTSKEQAESLLSGYLSADGHYVEKHDRWMASSVSRALLLGMALVAQRARGVVASVYAGRGPRTAEIQGRTVNCKQDWIFAFRNSDGCKKSGWIEQDGAWKKVRRLESADLAEVWDLQIEGDESFTAEGCIVHNCPLQLTVIRRAIELWSNPGDVVLSPFAGIGSEGYVALTEGRRFVGAELKHSYFRQACRNLEAAIQKRGQGTLFAEAL